MPLVLALPRQLLLSRQLERGMRLGHLGGVGLVRLLQVQRGRGHAGGERRGEGEGRGEGERERERECACICVCLSVCEDV